MTSPTDATPDGEATNHQPPSRSGLCGLSGPLLAWIRIKAGWTREAFCRKIRWTKEDEHESGSARQFQTYEGSMEVSPLLVQRYRRVIGSDLFDELWEKARTLFGSLPPQRARRTSSRKKKR